jgi:hypothetical protein
VIFQYFQQELLLRLLYSAWRQRLWTLQEGLLSRNPVFALRNSILPMRAFYNKIWFRTLTPLTVIGLEVLKQYFAFMSNIMNPSRVFGLLRRRTSSKLEDEAIAIAPLLGFDTAALLEVNGEERMVRFWSSFKSVSREILNVLGLKLSTPGLRWAPKSMMNLIPLGHKALRKRRFK